MLDGRENTTRVTHQRLQRAHLQRAPRAPLQTVKLANPVSIYRLLIVDRATSYGSRQWTKRNGHFANGQKTTVVGSMHKVTTIVSGQKITATVVGGIHWWWQAVGPVARGKVYTVGTSQDDSDGHSDAAVVLGTMKINSSALFSLEARGSTRTSPRHAAVALSIAACTGDATNRYQRYFGHYWHWHHWHQAGRTRTG